MKLEEPFLTDPKQIKAWLDSVGVKEWSINADGFIDVVGTVYLGEKLGSLTKLPVRFGKVGGSFNCYLNQLASLEGVPKEVGGFFNCSSNQLVSLEGAPKQVGEDFRCYNNQLISLQGAPKLVSGNFTCNNNQLVSLEGMPKEVHGFFWCDHNLLVDFKGMEGVYIEKNLIVTHPGGDRQGYPYRPDNIIVSLNGLPKELYSKVQDLNVQTVLELEKKRAEIPLAPKAAEDLSSELELG